MTKSIGIVVADDHPLLRDGVIQSLQSAKGLDVLAEADSADSAVRCVVDCRPDIVLLDISMPGNGIEAARKISALPNPPRIIMLTVSEHEDDVIAALKAGAHGYVLKGVSAEDLVSTVRSIHKGQSYIPPGLAARIVLASSEPKSKTKSDDDLIDSLTAREAQILSLVSVGKSNKEVARELELQEKTVKHYMTIILQKLHAKNRVEAAVKAQSVWNTPGRS
jgi:DNA-binding NarL/FixJ family response regulator